MKILKLLLFVLLTGLGGFFIVFGEHDDSPGAQFLGLLIALGGLGSIVRHVRSVDKNKN